MKITPGTPEYFKFLKEVKEYYQQFESNIIQCTSKGQWHVSYPFDWASSFSEAEFQAWCVIRSTARCFLYPQYPVGKYFVDFGNPLHLVALEVDGKEFHKDKEKDIRRDKELLELGWKTFRVTGAEAFRQVEGIGDINLNDWYNLSSDDRETVIEYFMESVDGVIEAINRFYFNPNPDDTNTWLYVKTLERHRLIDFYL
jgi:very-short-patch-repair endonuclease